MRNGTAKMQGLRDKSSVLDILDFQCQSDTQMYSCSSQCVHKVRIVSVSHFTDRKTEAWEGYPASKGQN